MTAAKAPALHSASAPANLITKSLRAYVAAHPDLKYVFFGGKGGVGKTVMAGATAVWLAQQGRRTILVSTNPVHSLSGLLGQNVFGQHTPVHTVDRLRAFEIDTKDTIARSKQEIREKIQWFLKFAEISTKADEFVESASMNPAFEESAMFENMLDLMIKDEYDAYVFDTAPTANARRLLGMSKVYSLWVNKMMKSRQEAQTLREALSFTKKKEADPLMEYLTSLRGRMASAQTLLTNPEQTAFFFVTLPEALPIAVVGVVVNRLIQTDTVGPETSDFVRNRMAMQQGYMQEIYQTFEGLVRAIIPLYDTEVRGVPALEHLSKALFS